MITVLLDTTYIFILQRYFIPKNAHYILGFHECVQYGSNVCACSYSCKFVREYYEDSKERSEEQRKLLNSSWAAKRKISAEEREKRKAAELEAQQEMWKRVQEEMDVEKDKEALKQKEQERYLEEEKQETEIREKSKVRIEAA